MIHILVLLLIFEIFSDFTLNPTIQSDSEQTFLFKIEPNFQFKTEFVSKC